jgi:hypothetical protein
MTNHIAFYQFCSAVRRKGTLALCLALCVLGLALSASAQKPRFITFDAPGAGTGLSPCDCGPEGTYPSGINGDGSIVGFYMDSSVVYHGFLRATDGKITTFDAPGAGTIPYPSQVEQGTEAWGMNPEGAITGYYRDTNNVAHGYMRARDGRFTIFDDPNAGTSAWVGTQVFSINPVGAIAGTYLDAHGVCHGYLRSAHGGFTTFDVPGAGTGGYPQGTWPAVFSGMTPAGTIAGYDQDANNVYHGFLRAPDGAITEFDDPDAGIGAGQGTQGVSINPEGAITGAYCDVITCHGFLRAPDGKFTNFDVPRAAGTWASSINPEGAITGYCWDSSGMYHGFLRTPDGKFATFDAPGAGTESGQGTFPSGINPAGAITGSYLDAGNTYHGFLRTP